MSASSHELAADWRQYLDGLAADAGLAPMSPIVRRTMLLLTRFLCESDDLDDLQLHGDAMFHGFVVAEEEIDFLADPQVMFPREVHDAMLDALSAYNEDGGVTEFAAMSLLHARQLEDVTAGDGTAVIAERRAALFRLSAEMVPGKAGEEVAADLVVAQRCGMSLSYVTRAIEDPSEPESPAIALDDLFRSVASFREESSLEDDDRNAAAEQASMRPAQASDRGPGHGDLDPVGDPRLVAGLMMAVLGGVLAGWNGEDQSGAIDVLGGGLGIVGILIAGRSFLSVLAACVACGSAYGIMLTVVNT